MNTTPNNNKAKHKFNVRSQCKSRCVTLTVFDAALAAGWKPCVGAVLGAILDLVTTQPSLAFTLLLIYSAGFGLPFLIVGLFSAQATAVINRLPNFELLNSLLH